MLGESLPQLKENLIKCNNKYLDNWTGDAIKMKTAELRKMREWCVMRTWQTRWTETWLSCRKITLLTGWSKKPAKGQDDDYRSKCLVGYLFWKQKQIFKVCCSFQCNLTCANLRLTEACTLVYRNAFLLSEIIEWIRQLNWYFYIDRHMYLIIWFHYLYCKKRRHSVKRDWINWKQLPLFYVQWPIFHRAMMWAHIILNHAGR